MHIFVLYDFPMKRFRIYTLVSAVVFAVLLVILTELFGDHQPWGYYVVAGILFGLVYGAFSYLILKRKKGKDE